MASTTSTFYLYGNSLDRQFPPAQYRIKAATKITFPPYTGIVITTYNIVSINPPTKTLYLYNDDDGTWFNLEDLRKSLHDLLAPYGYTVNIATGDLLEIVAPFQFTLSKNIQYNCLAALGFTNDTTSTGGIISSELVANQAINTLTLECPWYPPSTISDQNVFMKIVSASTNAYEFSQLNSIPPVPYVISILNLPQPVGTTSTSFTSDCLRATELGIVTSNESFTNGPSILTHIPDGLQRLRFRIDQLTDYRTNLIVPGLTFVIMLQFDVAGTR